MDGTTLPDESTRRRIESLLFTASSAGGVSSWTLCRGGLSDARVWRVQQGDSAFAVRSIPEGCHAAHRAWIRQTLTAAAAEGLRYLAVPHTSSEGGLSPLNAIGGYEAAEWKSGQPVSATTDGSGVSAAVQGLARFHRALRRMPPSPRSSVPSFRIAGGRLDHARQRAAKPIDKSLLLRWPELAGVAGRLPAALRRAEQLGVPFEQWPNRVQPVHGDARPEHFLVESGALVGLIDFDAMRNDSPLADLARFAGELARGNREHLRMVVRIYQDAIGESVDHRAVEVLDLVAATFSAANWIGWLSDLELSKEYDPVLVRDRLASIDARLGA